MSVALHYSFRKINHHELCDEEQIAEDAIEQVYLKFCDLCHFPEWLGRLKNLTHINISSNNIEEIPKELGILRNLNYLDVSDNRLVELSPVLFDLYQLKYLDVSGNFIEELPREIKRLTSLELLNFDRNFITTLPEEISQCTNIFQMSFEGCSRLFTIPRMILMMPNLIHVSFRYCNILSLPSMISQKIMNLLVNGNQLLNCLPHEYLRYLEPTVGLCEFYSVKEEDLSKLLVSQKEIISRSSEVNHVTTTSGTVITLPQEFEKIFSKSSPELISLKELSLRASYQNDQENFFIPKNLRDVLQFPTASCTCQVPIFTEAFACFFYEKLRADFKLPISRFFCSKKCLLTFCETHRDEFIFIL